MGAWFRAAVRPCRGGLQDSAKNRQAERSCLRGYYKKGMCVMCNTQDKNKESAAKLREFVTKKENSDWSKTLYESYSELFRHDNSQIWITGAILIPLSLAGLTVYKEACASQVILMALGSGAMIWFWYFMQRKFRAFQDGNRRVTDTIEEALGLESVKKLRKPILGLEFKYLRGIPIKWLNLYMAWAITIIWVLASSFKVHIIVGIITTLGH